MIDKVAELNHLLIAIDELKDSAGAANRDSVIRLCEGTVIEGRRPTSEAAITFAEKIGLINLNKASILLTPYGECFLSLNTERLYELSEEQKKLLIRVGYLQGSFRMQIHGVLKDFLPDFKQNTFKLSIFDIVKPTEDLWIIEHLTQLDFLIRKEDILEINSQYVDTVAHFLSEGKWWSPDDFEEYRKEREETGKLAEQLVIEYEKERLHQLGCKVEALCMRHISKLKVDAGYDVDSFDGSNPGLNYNRFIEIKGSKNSKVIFFWSDNEIEVAKKLGDKYWIYFQGGINTKTKKAINKPLIFQNPIKTILENPAFKKRPQGLIVESYMDGELSKFQTN